MKHLLFGDPYFWSNARPIAFKIVGVIILYVAYRVGYYRGKKSANK